MDTLVPAQNVNFTKDKFKFGNFLPASIRGDLFKFLRVRLVVLLGLIVISVLLLWKWGWISVLLWCAGISLGWIILEFDFLLRTLIEKSRLVFEQKWEDFWKLFIVEVNTKPNTIVRSVLFQVVIGLLSVYVASSSSYFLAQGLVLAVGGRIIFEQIMDMVKGQSVAKWFWQFDLQITDQLQSLWVFGWLLIWFALAWWMI